MMKKTKINIKDNNELYVRIFKTFNCKLDNKENEITKILNKN